MVTTSGVQEVARAATDWRRDFHRHPELMFDVHRTAGLVAERLRAFGCDEVVTGVGRTGVVGVIRGRHAVAGAERNVVGLRADMDALPIAEQTNLPYASAAPGRMHACGHDGHTAMLLGAAKVLCDTRDFAGSAVLIFQPAEEGGGGGRVMVEEGLMDRFAVEEVYGMHNLPGLPVGAFSLRPGPIMAAADAFEVVIEGRGGHAAYPHACLDPVLAGAQMVTALQSIVSRNVDPLEACVLSVTQFRGGSAHNAIPQEASFGGTVRTLEDATREFAERRFRAIVSGLAAAMGVTASVRYSRGYPVTRNDRARAAFATGVAGALVGTEHVEAAMLPIMGAEDFSYMLEARPGAMIFVGNGDTAGLHHPAYDFNDAAMPVGIAYWINIVETALAA